MNSSTSDSWARALHELRNDPSLADLAAASYLAGTPVQEALRYAESAEFGAVKTLLPPVAGLALEVGSGTGFLAIALAMTGWQVVALEPTFKEDYGCSAIAAAASMTACDVLAVCQFAECMPFRESTFDLVIGRQVLHHAKDLRAFLGEASRVSKPKAPVIFLREHVLNRAEDLDQFLRTHPLQSLTGDEGAFTEADYLAGFSHAGLSLTLNLGPADSIVNTAPRHLEDLGTNWARSRRLPVPVQRGLNRLARLKLRHFPPTGSLHSFVLTNAKSVGVH